MKNLSLLVQELESNFDFINDSDLSVSSGNVGWHLDHCLKVILVISANVEQSDITNYKRNFNIKRSLVFLSGIIPRGKGKAPKSVQPPAIISAEELKNQMQLVKIAILKFSNWDPGKNCKHPYFGVLNVKNSQKFLKIHTHHHLKIIKDIIARK